MDLSRFVIPGEKERVVELSLRTGRLIWLRWFYISLLGLVTIVTTALAGGGWESVNQFAGLILVPLALNGVLALMHQSFNDDPRLLNLNMILQVMLDIGLASFVIYDRGGFEARTTLLYAMPMISAGLLFSSRIVYLTAGLSSVGYALALAADVMFRRDEPAPQDWLLPMVFYPATFFILARLVIYLTSANTAATREAAYDSFLSLLTHQLKHPASTAAAILDMLDTKSEKFDKQSKHYLYMLRTENKRLVSLIDNLLATAVDVDPGDRAVAVDAVALLKGAAVAMAEFNQRVDDLHFQLPKQPPTVLADSRRLSLAFENVLDNAFRYSDAGTKVNVSAEAYDGELYITVADHGQGIGRRERLRLMSKYAIGNSSMKGLGGAGIGLYVAHKVITAHEGTIKVHSRPKQGTTVIISLKEGS